MTLSTPQLHALAEEHGTPLFVIDAALARQRAQQLREALGGRAEVLYAAKANAHPVVLAALRPAVDGADCTSAGELDAARQAGFPDEQLQLSGPAKDPAGLGAVTVSLSCVDEGARAAGPALLRVNPLRRIQAFRSTTGGVSPFGVPEEDLPAALDALADAGVDLRGLHVHRGSQCSSAAAWRRHALAVLDLAHACRLRPLRRLNLGGGFASPRPGVPAVDLAGLRPLVAALDRFTEAHPGVAFAVEPGRFLVGEAGVLLLRSVRPRTVRGRALAVLDGGLDCFLFASEGQRPGPPHAVDNLSRAGAPEPVELFGPSCTPRDRFGAPTLVRPERGDLLCLRGAGAYAWGASPHGFLGRPAPGLVVV